MASELIETQSLNALTTPALLEFARRYYGAGSHQSNPGRLEWLTRHNPLAAGQGQDVVVAVRAGGEVVGCHWKTRLAWSWEGTRLVIPSLHDLAIDAEYRNGSGFGLIMGALAGEKKAGLLGLSATANAIYERMRCPAVPMHRLQKILSYPRTLLGMMGVRLATPAAGFEFVHRGVKFTLVARPDEGEIAAALAISYRGRCRLEWTPETYAWRFFHPLGPRHYLLYNQSMRAVFSLGVRKGATLSRLVDAAVERVPDYGLLFEAMEQAMRRLGVAVATIATTTAPALDSLPGSGWKEQQGVGARFFLRGTVTLDCSELDLWGGSYDYGYDAN